MSVGLFITCQLNQVDDRILHSKRHSLLRLNCPTIHQCMMSSSNHCYICRRKIRNKSLQIQCYTVGDTQIEWCSSSLASISRSSEDCIFRRTMHNLLLFITQHQTKIYHLLFSDCNWSFGMQKETFLQTKPSLCMMTTQYSVA